MDELVGKSKASRRLLRNLIAGLCGFAVALALVLAVLRVQDYVPAWFVKMLLFAVPLPVACGLAVGLVSPRKAIAWAPLWSGIFALMLLAVLSSGIHEVGLALSAERVACIFAGAVLSAAAGMIGQWVTLRGYAGLAVVGLVVLCGGLAGLGHQLYIGEMRLYERDIVPQVLLEVDRDYIAMPKGIEWKCERRMETGEYALRSTLNGRPIILCASSDGPALTHIEYSVPGAHEDLPNDEAVRAYVKKWGLRDSFLMGLSEAGAPRGCWRSALRGTRLTVWRDGRMSIDALPIDLDSPRKPLGRSSDLR